jgi:hypothetical protein
MKRATLVAFVVALGMAAAAAWAAVSAIHVENIGLQAFKEKGVRTVVSVVLVQDEAGRPVSGATVFAYWIFPNGISNDAPDFAVTDGSGVATFMLSGKHFQRGTYTFRIDDVVLEPQPFDRAGSVLEDTIRVK